MVSIKRRKKFYPQIQGVIETLGGAENRFGGKEKLRGYGERLEARTGSLGS